MSNRLLSANSLILSTNMQKMFFVFSKIVFIFFLIFFFLPKYSFAQDVQSNSLYESPYACPNFEFIKNMQKGTVDEDVFVLQQILNLDKRTLVAQTGPGSKGKESITFGNATRDALKRFQALFIEYIEVADGKFNQKTKTVMNNVCKGPFFTGLGGNVYDQATTSNDTVGPVIAIAGPKAINELDPFRAYIAANEPIKTPNLSGLIIEGATAGDVRKTSSTTYTFLVTPNEDVKEKITIQFEADSVVDLAGNKNEIASNEWEILVDREQVLGSSTTTDTSILDDILNSVVNTIATSTDCSTVGSVSMYDYTNPCYGRAPISSDPNSSQEEKKKDDSMMQMLQGLIQGLMQALGKGGTGGGIGGDAAGACSGIPTAQYSPIGPGIGGRTDVSGIDGGAGNNYTGFGQLPPGPIYGEKNYGSAKACQQQCKGKCLGGCCNPQNDVTGQPVTSKLNKGRRS